MAITISTILQLKVACVYARPCTLAGYKDERCLQVDSEVAALGIGGSASAVAGTRAAGAGTSASRSNVFYKGRCKSLNYI